jgi:hypothetical protein
LIYRLPLEDGADRCRITIVLAAMLERLPGDRLD